MPTEDLRAISRWSRAMTHACLVAAALYVFGAIYRVATFTPASLADWLDVPEVHLTAMGRVAVFVAVVVPAAINAYGLLRLRTSFQLFARGEIFSANAILGLRRFAAAAGLSVIVAGLAIPLLGLVLTVNAKGEAEAPVHIGTGSMTIVLIAGVTWVFARILGIMAAIEDRNRQLAAENAAFV